MRRNRNARRMSVLALAGTLAFGLAPAEAAISPQTPPNDEAPIPLQIELSDAFVQEGGGISVEGTLAIPANRDLAVALVFAGTASRSDFQVSDPALVFEKGSRVAQVKLSALVDAQDEAAESILIYVTDPRVAFPDKVQVVIADVDAVPTRTIPAPEPTCSEAPAMKVERSGLAIAEGSGAATVTLVLAQPGCRDISVVAQLSGSADGKEIGLSAGSIEVPAGVLSASLKIWAVDDVVDEPAETVVVDLISMSGNDVSLRTSFAVLDNDADVSLVSLGGPPQVVAGTRTQLKMVVVNRGYKDAVGVRLVESPVAGLGEIEWNCYGKAGATCPLVGKGFVDLTASMPGGSAIVVVVDALVAASQRDALLHQASISLVGGALVDPNPGDNAAFATQALDVVADLALELAVAEWDPENGATSLTYTMTVRNLGPSDASGAELTSPIAKHLSWSGGDETCVASPQSVTCSVGALAVGQSAGLDMVLAVLDPYPPYTWQEAWLSPVDPDPAPRNDEAFLETKLDVFAPKVRMVDAIGATTTETLASCSQLAEAPARLSVHFSEPMSIGGQPGDADAVASYRLYRPGPDGEFDVDRCDANVDAIPTSDDVEVTLKDATWNDELAMVDLQLQGLLANDVSGQYRLLVCGSLTDLGDNPIDGNGDGESGDDALIGYRVDPGNMIANGHFDCELDGWVALVPSVEDWTLGVDASNRSSSGSGRLDNSAAWPAVGAGQCVATGNASAVLLELRYRLSEAKVEAAEELGVGGLVDAAVGVACSYFATTTCDSPTGSAVSEAALTGKTAPPPSASWTTWAGKFEVPQGTGSMLCTVTGSGEYVPFVLEIDQVRMQTVEWGPTDLPVDELGGEAGSKL